MKKTGWGCDFCEKQAETFGLPANWLEVSFWNAKWFRYQFCGYSCLTAWSEKRENYYGNRNSEEVKTFE